ncbi:MAG: 50S ribosomal protein L23 [Mariprofundaceae bacterium]
MSPNYDQYRLLKGPLVTEKSYQATGANNQYTFNVERHASKQQIRAAIESIFEVKVENVQVINLPGKTKRRGVHSGRRPGRRKAVVRLAEGFSIEMMEEA